VSRCRAGIKPTNANPITMVTIPPMRCSTVRFSASTSITPNTEAVAATNTTVNPATNNAAATVIRHRPATAGRTGEPGDAGAGGPAAAARYDT
jgi:hypothetical protein